ncbi:ComC/BlpC family leader-containing pheromone/bacteriocin [Streptococcus merionis]|uniref:ComC/BlpC family leader-containing pheromone/bacteriocin n=1 Tax=Streptococcus merionis TaxID=400065 RepID=UPI003511D9BB
MDNLKSIASFSQLNETELNQINGGELWKKILDLIIPSNNNDKADYKPEFTL